MKATTTLGNLIEQVETMSAGNFDETVSLSEIEFSSLKEMWIGGVGVEVLPQAKRLLANRLGVPFSYLERCPADLQAENLNYWLEQEQGAEHVLLPVQRTASGARCSLTATPPSDNRDSREDA
jgi:hypothetical protein